MALMVKVIRTELFSMKEFDNFRKCVRNTIYPSNIDKLENIELSDIMEEDSDTYFTITIGNQDIENSFILINDRNLIINLLRLLKFKD